LVRRAQRKHRRNDEKAQGNEADINSHNINACKAQA
jgi:hypothetical protein